MKKNELKGIVHDFLNLSDYQTPLKGNSPSDKIRLNLLTGEILGTDEERLIRFYKEKRNWFKKRIKNLKGNLNSFDFAKVTISGKTEKIELSYKKKIFSGTLYLKHLDLTSYAITTKLSWQN